MITRSGERFAEANGISICYETFGSKDNPALLLVSGLGVQMLGWAPELCEMLVERGFFVIRYDNRDVGKSTRFEGQSVPKPAAILANILVRKKLKSAYLLSDMAADGIGLLDALGIDTAHIFGVSMGGMIVQTMAIEHRDRVLSMTSMMSSTNERDLASGTPAAMRTLLTPVPEDLEGYVAESLAKYDVIAGSGYPLDEERMLKFLTDSHQRGRYPAGVGRQLGAILASGGRREALRDVHTPALIIHGDEDPLIRYQGGKDTAKAMPNAKLVTYRGLGHTLPIALWEKISDEVARVAGL